MLSFVTFGVAAWGDLERQFADYQGKPDGSLLRLESSDARRVSDAAKAPRDLLDIHLSLSLRGGRGRATKNISPLLWIFRRHRCSALLFCGGYGT